MQVGALPFALRARSVARGAVLLEQFLAHQYCLGIVLKGIGAAAVLTRHACRPRVLKFRCEKQRAACGQAESEKALRHIGHCYLPLSLEKTCSISYETPKRKRNPWLLSLSPKPGETLKVIPTGVRKLATGAR